MTYTTVAGDTFDSAAFKALGSCRWTEKLINKNRQFVDTVIFKAGVELELPDISNERQIKMPPWRTET
ncbi:MAG: tail protein X [Selenomonadaceae bacterium]|nr:tail protein X [Selenomonadaceae bacterium]MBR1805811.1 tail protein X [Selenomonadaceae bacterium]